MRLKFAVTSIVAFFTLLVFDSRASAYPEFLLSTGATRCSECHFSPTGGGLLNDYGRDEAASTISADGDGRFMHGVLDLPKPLALGADLRLAALANQVRGSREIAAFPMQADVYAHLQEKRLSLSVTAGALAAIRKPSSIQDRVGAREYYAMYTATSKQWYARAGRFHPKAGLRMPDHTAFVRRFTGRYLLEEAHAIAAGYNKDETEWNLALITPLAVGPSVGQKGWGASANWQRLLSDSTAVASLGSRALRSDDGTSAWLTSTYSNYFEGPDLLVQSEIDVGGKQALGRDWIGQLVWFGGVHWKPASPLSLAVTGHYYDSNITRVGQERSALDLSLRHFWKGHFELSFLLRGEQVAFEHGAGTALLQAHYFL